MGSPTPVPAQTYRASNLRLDDGASFAMAVIGVKITPAKVASTTLDWSESILWIVLCWPGVDVVRAEL
jgi:hypothetical protein